MIAVWDFGIAVITTRLSLLAAANKSLDVVPVVTVLLFVPAFIEGLLIEGPIWAVLHRMKATQTPIFTVVGALVTVAEFCAATGPRLVYLTVPTALAPVFGGAVSGWVLHWKAYVARYATDVEWRRLTRPVASRPPRAGGSLGCCVAGAQSKAFVEFLQPQ